MTASVKYAMVAVGAVFLADKIAGTFTDGNDSESEKLLWKVASAALVGFIGAKLV